MTEQDRIGHVLFRQVSSRTERIKNEEAEVSTALGERHTGRQEDCCECVHGRGAETRGHRTNHAKNCRKL